MPTLRRGHEPATYSASRQYRSGRHFVVKLSPFATPCSADLDANYNFSLAPVQDLLSPWLQGRTQIGGRTFP
ncbi:Associate of C-myc [Zea mays]|uniref:Associate of C-myc n=1 Tax=Zea mays TaxID=4577 RepID=A0A1D6HUA6_MAIZE|nr:Associate of C-myc [Zea mays]